MLDHDVDQLTTKKLASRLLDDCSSLGVPTLRFHLNFLNRLLPWRDMLGAPNLEGISTGKTPYHIYIFGVGNNIYGSLENYELYISIQPTNWLQISFPPSVMIPSWWGFLKTSGASPESWNRTFLVGGIPTPLKNMSQLGWWHSQYMEK